MRAFIEKQTIHVNIRVNEFEKFCFVKITFSYTCSGRENIVFGTKFRNGDFHGFTRYEDP